MNLKVIDLQAKKKEKEKMLLLDKIESSFTILEIESGDLPTLIHFCFSSYHAALQSEQEKLLHMVEQELFEELEEDLQSYLDEGETLCDLELSFLDVVLLHDNLEMYIDSLVISKESEKEVVCVKYLKIIRPFIESNKSLYQDTMRYLIQN